MPSPGRFAASGQLLIHDSLPAIGTADGLLVLDTVQPAGKKADARSRIPAGRSRLGNLTVPEQDRHPACPAGAVSRSRHKSSLRMGLSELTIAGQSLNQLADRYGTPLYLYDQATLDNCLSSYSQSLSKYYPGSSGITYAGKAFLCLAMAQWAAQQGISLDCSSAGELYIATQAGLPRQQIIAHGVNKSAADLQAAIQHAGTLVVDNLQELSD